MKKRTFSLFVVFFLLVTGILPTAAVDFAGHWASEAAQQLIGEGIILPDENGDIRPDDSITRAEFVKITNRVFGFKAKAASNFADIPEGEWYYDEFLIARQAGYIAGDENGNANPGQPIKRDEISVILYRILKLSPSGSLDRFVDKGEIPVWAADAVATLADKGYLNGYPDSTFGPGKNVSRGESFTILAKFLAGKGEINKPDTGNTVGTITGSVGIDRVPGSGGSTSGGSSGGGNAGSKILAVPSIVRFDESTDTLYWKSVSNAAAYEVKISFSGEERTGRFTGTNASITDLIWSVTQNTQNSQVEIGISIKAVAANGYTDSAYSKELTATKSLNAVSQPALQSEITFVEGIKTAVITWQEIPNSNGVRETVTVDGVSVEDYTLYVQNRSLSIPYSQSLRKKTVKVTLQAVSAAPDSWKDSTVAETEIVFPLPEGKITNGIFKYKADAASAIQNMRVEEERFFDGSQITPPVFKTGEGAITNPSAMGYYDTSNLDSWFSIWGDASTNYIYSIPDTLQSATYIRLNKVWRGTPADTTNPNSMPSQSEVLTFDIDHSANVYYAFLTTQSSGAIPNGDLDNRAPWLNEEGWELVGDGTGSSTEVVKYMESNGPPSAKWPYNMHLLKKTFHVKSGETEKIKIGGYKEYWGVPVVFVEWIDESNVAALTEIRVNDIPLADFSPDQFEYTFQADEVTSVTAKAMAEGSKVTVAVQDEATYLITVTAPDLWTTATYTLHIAGHATYEITNAVFRYKKDAASQIELKQIEESQLIDGTDITAPVFKTEAEGGITDSSLVEYYNTSNLKSWFSIWADTSASTQKNYIYSMPDWLKDSTYIRLQKGWRGDTKDAENPNSMPSQSEVLTFDINHSANVYYGFFAAAGTGALGATEIQTKSPWLLEEGWELVGDGSANSTDVIKYVEADGKRPSNFHLLKKTFTVADETTPQKVKIGGYQTNWSVPVVFVEWIEDEIAAALKEIRLDGQLIDGFDPDVTEYTVSAVETAELTALPLIDGCKVDISNQGSVYTITVTALDGETTRVYTVIAEQEKPQIENIFFRQYNQTTASIDKIMLDDTNLFDGIAPPVFKTAEEGGITDPTVADYYNTFNLKSFFPLFADNNLYNQNYLLRIPEELEETTYLRLQKSWREPRANDANCPNAMPLATAIGNENAVLHFTLNKSAIVYYVMPGKYISNQTASAPWLSADGWTCLGTTPEKTAAFVEADGREKRNPQPVDYLVWQKTFDATYAPAEVDIGGYKQNYQVPMVFIDWAE